MKTRFAFLLCALSACLPIGAPRLQETGEIFVLANRCEAAVQVLTQENDGTWLGTITVTGLDVGSFLVPGDLAVQTFLLRPGKPPQQISFNQEPDGAFVHLHTSCDG